MVIKMKNVTCDVIRNLYEEEMRKDSYESIETIQLTMQLSAEHKFLLEALSERFKVSQSSIARPILERALENAFLSLVGKDEDTVAEYADNKINDFMVKVAKDRGGKYERVGLGHWASLAYCTKRNDDEREEAA